MDYLKSGAALLVLFIALCFAGTDDYKLRTAHPPKEQIIATGLSSCELTRTQSCMLTPNGWTVIAVTRD